VYNVKGLINNSELFSRLCSNMNDHNGHTFLRCAKIKITPRCNLQCIMCKYWRSDERNELSSEKVFELLDSLKRLNCQKVHFSGGELLLRDDIFDVLDFACKCGFKVNMTTNGTLINASKAEKLVKRGVNSITFSLDGPEAAIHDRIRGIKGAFKKTTRGIRLIDETRKTMGSRIKIRINVVIQRKNYLLIPEIMELGGALGAADVRLMPVDGKSVERWNLTKNEIREYNELIAPEILRIRKKYGFPIHETLIYPFGKRKCHINMSRHGLYSLGYYENHLCFAPWLHTFVAWDGNVYLCCMSRGAMEPLGNINNQKLDEIFTGTAYKQRRKDFLEDRAAFCAYCDDFLLENDEMNDAVARVTGKPGIQEYMKQP